jgi:hypothetical protein
VPCDLRISSAVVPAGPPQYATVVTQSVTQRWYRAGHGCGLGLLDGNPKRRGSQRPSLCPGITDIRALVCHRRGMLASAMSLVQTVGYAPLSNRIVTCEAHRQPSFGGT